MAHLETKWVRCCQARAFHLILLSLPSDCHPLVNTWCCHQHWYHYSYAWEGDAFTLAAGSPSVRHFHFIMNQTTNGVALSWFLFYATGVEPVWVYTLKSHKRDSNTSITAEIVVGNQVKTFKPKKDVLIKKPTIEHRHAIYKVVKQRHNCCWVQSLVTMWHPHCLSVEIQTAGLAAGSQGWKQTQLL